MAELARKAITCIALYGVARVVKHTPVHDRAMVDSHESVTNIDADVRRLSEDFESFLKLNDAQMAMMGRVAYQILVSNVSVTHSKTLYQ